MYKTVLITGASRGIGRAIACAYAREGCRLVINCSRSEKELLALADELRETCHVDVLTSIGDVSDYAYMEQLFSQSEARFGGVDILVNNAGVSDSTPLDKYTAEHFANVMDLNVNAMMNGILPAAAIMKEQGGGCILNTSSMVSICGQPGGVAYPSSKYAVNGLTWSLARELGPFHIRVNAVAPGITRTDMVAALPKEMIDPLISHIPLRRIGEAEDIANAFLFLASDMASYITGEILSVDGAMRT